MKAVLVGFPNCGFCVQPSRAIDVRLLAFLPQALLQRTDEIVRNDKQITTREPETELSAPKGSINNIVYVLGYSKMCSCLVPRLKTDCHKTTERGAFRYAFL